MSRHIRLARWCTLAILAVSAASPAAARQAPPPSPDRMPGTVTLRVGDYDLLLDRASAQPAGAVQPPIPAVVARAELTGRVDGEVARGTLRLEGEVFQRGAVKVPLVSGATLAEGRADGRTLPLLQDGDAHVGILDGPAPFVVTLDWAAPIEPTPGRVSVLLPQPASGTGTASLDLPGDPGDVRVEPGLVTDRQSANGRTTVRLTLTAGTRTRVSWSVRETAGQATPVEVRLLGEVKSLITIGDGDLRLSSLIDVIVVRGEPREFQIQLPAGYEMTSVTGATLDRQLPNGNVVTLQIREPERRRHQFIVTLEQSHAPGSFKADTSFPTIVGVQRESGEVLVEGGGTLQVMPATDDTVRRMDVREAHAALRGMSRQPALAAFRYQRRPGEPRQLALDVKRFADAPVLSAIAERASATTLVTSEGRMLTEMTFVVRNRAQPFMKVTLPPGASILSSEVAGETSRPVTAADGTRVPLMRANLRSTGPYTVSFVYLHGGQALTKKGDAQLALATVDIPVSVLEWELFLPEQYSAKPIGGNVIPMPIAMHGEAAMGGVEGGIPGGVLGGVVGGLPAAPAPPPPGTRDEAVKSGASETVTVLSESRAVASDRIETGIQQEAPSQNIVNMQRKVAGVLPVRVDVPRAGTSYRFVRPLVLNEETSVSFRYKRR